MASLTAAARGSCEHCASLQTQAVPRHTAIMMRHRMCYSTAARKGRQAEAPTAGERQPPAVPSGAVRVDPDTAGQPVEKDMWEGEQFEALGQLSSYFIPLLAVLALLVGLFASSTYDEGATVFLDAPKSAEDSAKLVPAVQLQRE